MKLFKLMLPILALAIGIGGSAFTHYKSFDSDLVWFQVDPNTGEELDATAGYQGDVPPAFMNCNDEEALCARALSIDQHEVEPNATPGSFSIASNVDITLNYDEQRFKKAQ